MTKATFPTSSFFYFQIFHSNFSALVSPIFRIKSPKVYKLSKYPENIQFWLKLRNDAEQNFKYSQSYIGKVYPLSNTFSSFT